MSDIELDCKGLPCPQPVLRCKQCIEQSAPSGFSIVVDNDAARENVTRFLSTQGYETVEETTPEGHWRLAASRQGAEAPQPLACDCEVMDEAELRQLGRQKICVFITSRVLGVGDDELGEKLMNNFVATLPELGEELWRIILVNDGVKLAIQGSDVLDTLARLEQDGVSIIVCGTCLDFFQLLDQKAVGQTTNMLDVVTSLQLASKVIRP